MSETTLQPMEKEIILEIGNASINAASQSLASFVSGAINVQPPDLKLISMDDLSKMVEKGLFARIVFSEGLTGQQFLFFPAESGALLAALLLGKEPPAEPPEAPDKMEESALSEVVGMLMGVYTTSLSGFIGGTVGIDPPQTKYISPAEHDFAASGFKEQEQWVELRFTFEFESDYKAIYFHYIPYYFMKEIIAPLMPEQSDGEVQQDTMAVPDAERAALTGHKELPAMEEALSAMQKDALAEIGNISLGASATALSELLNRRVQITTPALSLTTMGDVRANYPVPCLVITVNYIKGLAGYNVLILNNDDALTIVGVMMGMEPPDKPPQMGEMELSGIGEAMNQMMGTSATAMSNLFGRLIDISPPHVEIKDLKSESLDTSEMDDDSMVVKVAFHMEVEGLLDSHLLQLIPLPFAKEMADSLLVDMDYSEPGSNAGIDDSMADSIKGDFATQSDSAADDKEEEGMLSDFEIFARASDVEQAPETPPGAASSTTPAGHDYSRIDMIRDIPINIHVLLGKTRLPLKKVFSLLPGEIITLERYLGESVEIYANDHLVAKGEVVIVNGQVGIKIIDIFRSQ